MNNLDSIKASVKDAEDSGVSVIGFIVQWSIERDASVAEADLRQTLADKKMDPALIDAMMPPKVSAKKSFRRAIQKINRRKKRSDGSTKEMKRIRVGQDMSNAVCYGMVHVDPDSKKREFDLKNVGHVFLQDGKVGGNNNELIGEVRKHMSMDLSGFDIRDMLARWARSSQGFPTRPSGGVWFVPNTGDVDKQLDDLIEIIEMISNKSILVALPMLGSNAAKKNLSKSFTSNMIEDIERFKEDCEKFFSDPRKKQKKAALRRIEDASNLKRFAMAYEAILDANLSDLSEMIEKIEDSITVRVAEIVSGVEDIEDEEDECEETEEEVEAEVDSE